MVVPVVPWLLGDWWVGFPRGLRAAGLGIWLGWVLWTVWRQVVRPYGKLPQGDALALFIERSAPSLRSRLISAVQLGRDSLDAIPAAFVDRLQADAHRAAATLDPRTLVPVEGLRRQAWRTLPGLLVLGIWLGLAWPTSGILIRRALLEDVAVPRKTRLLEVTGPVRVGRGDEVTLRARAEGMIPDAGVLEMRHGSGRVQTVPLDREPGKPGAFARVLPGLASSFQYRVRVNDAESEPFTVEVLPRPLITNLTLTQVWPAYTGRGEQVRRAGELSLLKGSRLRVEGEANRPLTNAVLRIGGADRMMEAELDAGTPDRVRFEFPVDDERINSLTLDLKDRDGIPSRDSAVYAVEVVPDRAPQVRLVLPARREELATRRGTVLVAFEAEDDVGLGELWLCHQAAGSTNTTPVRVALEVEKDVGTALKRRVDWVIASMKPGPAEGAMIEFWIEATDRNDVAGPGVGRSEKYLLRVVSEAEKRADLLARAGDAIGRLGDVAQGQDRLNESLGRIIMLRQTAP
ncbi:MAG: hypothetical protein IT580_01245 [Verrucomicrobiales bacterium]|nr:hypothetical protein [Verrucomicrobiales bacterium]